MERRAASHARGRVRAVARDGRGGGRVRRRAVARRRRGPRRRRGGRRRPPLRRRVLPGPALRRARPRRDRAAVPPRPEARRYPPGRRAVRVDDPSRGRALARARRGRGRGRRPRRRLARRRVRLPRRRRPRPPRRHVHGPRRAVRLGFRPRLSRRRRGGGVLVLDPGRRRPRPHGPPRERGRRPRRPRLRPRAPRRRRRRRVRRVRRVALLLRSSLGLRRRVFVGRPRGGSARADPKTRPERRRTRPERRRRLEARARAPGSRTRRARGWPPTRAASPWGASTGDATIFSSAFAAASTRGRRRPRSRSSRRAA